MHSSPTGLPARLEGGAEVAFERRRGGRDAADPQRRVEAEVAPRHQPGRGREPLALLPAVDGGATAAGGGLLAQRLQDEPVEARRIAILHQPAGAGGSMRSPTAPCRTRRPANRRPTSRSAYGSTSPARSRARRRHAAGSAHPGGDLGARIGPVRLRFGLRCRRDVAETSISSSAGSAWRHPPQDAAALGRRDVAGPGPGSARPGLSSAASSPKAWKSRPWGMISNGASPGKDRWRYAARVLSVVVTKASHARIALGHGFASH